MSILKTFFYKAEPANALKANSWLNAVATSFGGFASSRYRRSGITTNMGSPMTFEQAARLGYKLIPWVRACVDYWGTTLGAVDWRVYEKGSNKPIRDHELACLINQPNPHKTKTDFFRDAYASLALSGSLFVQKVVVSDRRGTTKTGKKVKELWVMRPDWIAPVPDENSFISGFELVGGVISGTVFKPEDVIYMYYPDPTNPFVGISPLSSAVRSIQSEEAAHTWNTSLLENYAQPSGILYSDNHIVAEDREQLKEEIQEAYSGGNLYSPMLLWSGLKWQQISINNADLQFAESRSLAKFEICAVLQTPAILVGALPDPNYSNASVARLSFLEDRVIPMCAWFRDSFNRAITPFWGDDIELRFDLSRIPAMRKALMDKASTAKILVGMGVPLNAVNEKLDMGFDPVPWGDVAWMSTSVMPVSDDELDVPMLDASGNEADDTEDPEEPEDDSAEDGTDGATNDDPNALEGEDDEDPNTGGDE